MRFYTKFLVFMLIAAFAFGCSSSPAEKKNQTPLETLKAYGNAYKKKDMTAMKLLLSQESLKMHEREAKAQNVTVDDIVRRETLFSENQKSAEFRNERIDGDKATIEMKDSSGIWNTIYFVREDGTWKIDRKGFAEQIQQDAQQSDRKLDDVINQGRIDDSNPAFNSSPPVNSNQPTNANPEMNSNPAINANQTVNFSAQP